MTQYSPAPPLPVSDERIQELIWVCRDHNVFPLFLEHHYPGQTEHPVDQFLSTLIPEVAGYLKAHSPDALEEMFRQLPFGMFPGRFGVGHRDLGDPITLERLALGWVIWRTNREYFSWDEVVAPTRESAVLARFPELAAQIDKHGLLQISDEMVLKRGGIIYRDHVLHYHQGLRRGFSSNPNFDFLELLLRYRANSGDRNTFRIGIDHRRLMRASFYREMYESDRWYGAPFDRERLDDRHDVGVTSFVRTQPSPLDFFFGKLNRTEVLRSVDGDVKTFEIEELNAVSEARGDMVLNRYIHAERDMRKGAFRHFDGAVKIYLRDQYAERMAGKLPHKDSHKKLKVFRIDGDIDAEVWINLTLLFFRGNELVLEYFDPNQYQAQFGPEIARYQQLVADGALSHQ